MKKLFLSLTLIFSLASLAVADEVDELIRRGRTHLAGGEAEKALILFEQADAETRGELRTRMWVLRAWMAQGRINDAFDHLEKNFTSKGKKGPDTDYLFGMGSYLKAQKMIAENVPSSTTGFAFNDAVMFLKKATEADPQKYTDAYQPLADAAWNSQDLATAIAAVEKAVGATPKDANTRYLKARIHLSQFVTLNADEAQKDKAQEHLATCITTLDEAAKLVPAPEQDPTLISAIEKQRGDVFLWKGDQAQAGKAYANAMGWEPTAVDYSALFQQLVAEDSRKPFVDCLTAGAERFEKIHGEKTNRDATLQWWLGYGRFTLEEYEGAETAFTKAVAKWPAYQDSWYYIGLSRYYRKDYDGFTEAMQKNWEASPTGLVTSISSNKDINVRIVSYVIGEHQKKAEAGDLSANEPAAFLSEVRTGVQPEDWVFWNDYGLFARGAGDYRRDRDKEGDKEIAMRHFERSYAAYLKAIEVAPNKPHLKNDGAVLLHYYLERDYDTAKAMYEDSYIQATELLAAGGLDEASKTEAEAAKKDSKDNLAKLEEKMAGGGDGE
ncbi:MAG: hypothetical protein GY711_04865 [bacterium]|nr:hypothetical protein [bacterium]